MPTEALEFLLAPMALTLLLVGIHSYLGLHVLKRGIIFVDISLSQVAVLGSSLSMVFFSDSKNSLYFSLLLCFVFSFVLTLIRHYRKNISEEAFIGLIYVFSAATLIILADKYLHSAEHLKQSLIGNILYVTWQDVLKTAIIYTFVGITHWLFRKKFWEASNSKLSRGSFFWDLFFYFLFSLVITFSTAHAGVIVVFSLLVAPALVATHFFTHIRNQLYCAWLVGTVSALPAFFISFQYDLPAGAALVCLQCLFVFILFLFKKNSK